FFFFFSSRRRHTRFDCDWSSDVCSSDLLNCPSLIVKSNANLQQNLLCRLNSPIRRGCAHSPSGAQLRLHHLSAPAHRVPPSPERSEERRVGKEWRCRGAS